MAVERLVYEGAAYDDQETIRHLAIIGDPWTVPTLRMASAAGLYELGAAYKEPELLEFARDACAASNCEEQAPQTWLDAQNYLASSPLYEDWAQGLDAPTSQALNETGRRYVHFANQLGLERPGKALLQNHMRSALFAALVARRGDVHRVALAAPPSIRRAYGCISAVAAYGQLIPCHVQPAGNPEETMPPDVVTVPLGTALTSAIGWRKQQLYELFGRSRPSGGTTTRRKRSDVMLYTIELLARSANGREMADIEEQYLDEATHNLLKIFSQIEAPILNDDGRGGIIM